MIGKDLVKYHNYIHGPVHYTESLDTFPLTDWGIPYRDFEGSSEDGLATKQEPFQGHMFIQGCVSAIGWLNDDGTCTKLATELPWPCRPVKVCGDHMRGALHFSHQTLTRFSELTSYDFRNAEVNFELNKDTFKTIVCDATIAYSQSLHIAPARISPGCVTTLRVIVPPDAPMSHVKLAFHPDLVWLTPKPIYVLKGFMCTISFECYGHRTRDVICSHREQCFEVCRPWGDCSLSALSGFDSEEGNEDDYYGDRNLSGAELTGCYFPLEFTPWKHDCSTAYNYNLSGDQLSSYMYDFKDYYDGDGGTRLWNISKIINRETNEYDKEWYYSGNQANVFKIRINRQSVGGYNKPPAPVVRIYKGNYKTLHDTPLSADLLYDSSLPEDPDHPWVVYLPGEDSYAVKFTREGGTQYMISLSADKYYRFARGTVNVACPYYYKAYRYVPNL